MVLVIWKNLARAIEVMMTEDFATQPDTTQKSSMQGKGPGNGTKLRLRALTISSVFLAITIIDSILQYREFGAWQILADAAGILVALSILLACINLFSRNRIDLVNKLVPFVILFGYAPGDLFLEGVTVYNLGSGLLLFALAYMILRPTNLPHWLRMLVLHLALVVLFSAIDLPRFDISVSRSWQVSLPIFTAVIALLLSWQLLKNFQIRTIQTRLLVILLSLGFIPTLVATATSTMIGFQRDIRQAEDYLQAISTLKQEQISTWFDQIPIDIDQLIEDPKFLDNLDFLVNYSPVESYRNQILSDLRNSMQNLRSETGRFMDISIMSTTGEILASTNQELEGTNISSEDGFKSGQSEMWRSPLEINNTTDLPEAKIYQPITLSGERTAVIVGNISTNNIVQTISESTQLGDTGEAYLVSLSNQLLTPLRNATEINPGSTLNLSPEAINDNIQNLGTQTLRGVNYQNQSVIGTYSWNPDLKTVLVIEQTENEAFQAQRLNLIINTTVGLVTLVITITIAFLTARNFSEPIKTLSEESSKVSQGDLKQIEPMDRIDEIGELSQAVSQMTSQLLQTTTNLEKTVAERTEVLERRAKYLETTSQISRALTSIYEIDDLLNSVTHLISENFGFYHVGVFINDDKQEYSVLRAANSEGGWKMLAREHKLKIGEQGIVGYVTKTGQPRIQQQVEGEDSIHFNNPDLPLTKSEMALPLKANNLIFGALDVQSTEEGAFTEEDVNVLQVLADSVTVAIQNTRLVQQLRENLETGRRLYGEITQDAWTSLYQRKTTPPAFRSDRSGTQLTSAPLSEIGWEALNKGETIFGEMDHKTGGYWIAVPVKVRGGVTVAVVETYKPQSSGQWTTEEITVLESVGEDLGMALENARLVEDTQRKAQRDRIAAELASKIWSSTDVENILQTAVRELGSALQVSRGTIRLTLPEESKGEINSDGANQI